MASSRHFTAEYAPDGSLNTHSNQPVERVIAVKRVVPTLSAQELVSAMVCEVRTAYSRTFDSDNLRRLASILALSDAELLILPDDKGYGDRGYIRRRGSEIDFEAWKKIFDLFIKHSELEDADFAPQIAQVGELLKLSPMYVSLANIQKSGKSTVLAHSLHFLERLNTDGLSPTDRIIMRMDLFHDVGKRYMYDTPFMVELLGQKVPDELKAMLRADELDYHGVFSAFEIEAFFKWLREYYPDEYEFVDDKFINTITRKFRLHHAPAQLDRKQLTPAELHSLFKQEHDFEQYLYPLLLRMVAADSGSVAAQSVEAAEKIDDPDIKMDALNNARERSRWAVKNVSFIFQLIIDLESYLEKTEQELQTAVVEPLVRIILRVIEKSEVKLSEVDEEMRKLLSTVAVFIQKYVPSANYSLLQQLATA